MARATIQNEACYFVIECRMGGSLGNDTDGSGGELDGMLIDLASKTTEAIQNAESIQYGSLDALVQGAAVLKGIVSGVVKDELSAKTLDMAGRESAVNTIANMAAAFREITSRNPVTDPNELKSFITDSTASVASIVTNLNSIVYASDLKDIPPSDVENALDMPYDTDIGEGDAGGEIPADPEKAMRLNVMKLTKINAVNQINKMINMVDDLGLTVVRNMIPGEIVKTNSPLGLY